MPALLLRRIHKWIGVILGAQFIVWTVSGALMAVLDMETVAGGPAPATAAPPPVTDPSAWPQVHAALRHRPVTGLAVRPLLDRQVIEVSTPVGVRLFDAANGRSIAIDALLARRIAEAGYTGAGPVKSVSVLGELTLAVREHELPIWQVDFADEQNSSFYVSATTGRLLERRNDTWRTWDFVWMLHNMDYANRTSFNHPLIVTVGFGIVWLAITGFYLLLKTAWRSDLRALRKRLRTWLVRCDEENAASG